MHDSRIDVGIYFNPFKECFPAHLFKYSILSRNLNERNLVKIVENNLRDAGKTLAILKTMWFSFSFAGKILFYLMIRKFLSRVYGESKHIDKPVPSYRPFHSNE